jgi:hypothetical protein
MVVDLVEKVKKVERKIKICNLLPYDIQSHEDVQ